jgi:putative thiamine transport system ATP-binding protein
LSSLTLELRDVSIDLSGRRLVGPLNLQIGSGECVTLMGPSGCGKSSLLAYVAGTLDDAFVARGGIYLDGEALNRKPPEQRGLGLLFQDDLLFPHLSVGGNLGFALAASSVSRSTRRKRIEDALEEAGLGGFADRDPATLSGGQRARVALLRTLMAQPRALLLDEPFSKLDTQLRQDIRGFVFEHARQRGLPMLLVTHDQADADAAAGPVLALWEQLAGNDYQEK